MDLSIVILSFRSKKHLATLLPSVLASRTKRNFEIIVVDNGSNDGTAEWLATQPNIKFIKNTNVGFAAGNNLGIKQARGNYVLLLNPDTKLEPETLELMLDFMETRPDVGISGCKLIKTDGRLDLACRRRFPNLKNSFLRLFLRDNKNYNYSDIDENVSMEVDSVVGAFMLIRRSLIDVIGLLDEDFFMYGEDLDYCWRCKQAGLKVWYYPKALAWHFKGESSRQVAFSALKWFHQAMWIFYKKHYAAKTWFGLNWLVFLGIKLRLWALLCVNFFRSRPRVSQ